MSILDFAKSFEPPSKDMPLRFRYTSYLGEKHPAENKVVMEFSPSDMPNLTDVQREKLKKLVGVRYNPDKDVVKMSCESFETQAQNKRYLGDLLDSLLLESRVIPLLINYSDQRTDTGSRRETHSRTSHLTYDIIASKPNQSFQEIGY